MRNKINIPNNIVLVYCKKKYILTLIGPLRRKSTKLKLEILVLKSQNKIVVSQNPTFRVSNAERKQLKALQGSTIILIKQLISETYQLFYKKLKFIGIGYRALQLSNFDSKLLLLKLGYSHNIYFRIPINSNCFLKKTNIFLFGNSYKHTTQLASLLRSLKKPEPYKGKGILYENELIVLKEGKKV